jgi:hypothetical protein
MTVVTEPGVYQLDEAEYHRDPVPGGSLSFSGAKRLLPPGCPALFHHERQHGRGNRQTFDFGHAAHSLVLGVGAPLAVIDADDYRKKAAQEARDAAYAIGEVPILASEHERVVAMAAAIKVHPVASRLFDPARGKPEQSLFRRHPSGTMLRSRVDWLPDSTPNGRMVLPDYKTCASAEPSAVEKAMANYAYHQQAAWYSDMVTGLGLAEDVTFVLVFQEKTAPYLVTVAEPDSEALAIGRALNNKAIELYADCVKRDRWPGYTDDIELISLPPWATYVHDLDVA